MRAAPTIEQIVETIVEHVHPRRVVLFGSHARGDAQDDSDVDLMVEMETDLTRSQGRATIAELFPQRWWAMDILICTPAEIAAQRDDPGTIVYAIEREGKVLYVRPDVAVPDTSRTYERPEEPESVDWWVAFADADLEVIDVLLHSESSSWNHIRFLSQQAAEKYLKALLISRWRRPDRTHDLRKVLGACREAGFPLLGLDNACETLSPHAVNSRYPHDFFAPPRPATSDEAHAALDAMRPIVAAARSALGWPRSSA